MKSGAVATLRFLFFIQKVFQHIDVGVIGGEVDLGLLVVWQALLQLLADVGFPFFGTFVGQDGTCLAGFGGSEQYGFKCDIQIYRNTMAVDPLDIVEKARGASSGGDDDIVEVGGGVKHLLFEAAKSLFAVALEKEWYGGVILCLKGLVEVVELVTHAASKGMTDSGFSTIHVANEVDLHSKRGVWLKVS